MEVRSVKGVIVGDTGVGKSSLLLTYTCDQFPDFIPSVGGDYGTKDIMVDKKLYHVTLWDTIGATEYDQLRSNVYPETNILFLLFSVVSPSSFENVSAKWIPELMYHAPNVPILLVGTKTDLRNDKRIPQNDILSFEQGEAKAREVKAWKYVECSALTKEGLNTIFDEAMRAIDSESITANTKRGCVTM